MRQVSWRVDDALLDRVRNSAADAGMSLNSFITHVLGIVVTEDDQLPLGERMRQRMRVAGILADYDPPESGDGSDEVSDEELAGLRRLAGVGKPLSEIVLEDRA